MAKERMLIAALEEGRVIIPDNRCYFLVRRAVVKTGKNNARYIDLELTDGTASINGKVWDVADDIEKTTEAGNIIKVMNGRVSKYQNSLQVVIEGAALVPPAELDAIPGIIPESPESVEALVARWQQAKELLDPLRRAVIDEFEASGRVWDLFRSIPAGKSMHHSYRRGLWEHSLNVAELSYSIAERYDERYPVNRMNILVGALIHDVGKIFEFQVNVSTSIVEKYSDRGRLLGHVYMGASFIEKILKKALPDNAELQMELLHIMLSHHGEYDFGSPKRPKTMDALIVAMADNLDANLDAVHIGMQGDMEENWTKQIYSLQRPFYKTAGPYKE